MNIALLYAHFQRQEGDTAGSAWTVQLVNAGLIAPLLRRADQCEYVDVNGLPLGVIPNARYTQVEFPLQPGDWLVLCSDGIVEAMSPKREMYGFDRLQERVLSCPASHAYDLIDWILTDVKTFIANTEPHDDMTLVVIRSKTE
jgi:sigma-B regulation protein RsbU (phosphoserine phosphatase)